MKPSITFHPNNLLGVVKTKDYYGVKSFLEQYGLAQNSRTNCLALIEAVKAEDYEIVQLLLEYGCLAEEAKTDVFYKSLDCAIENINMLKILLQAGASIAGKDYKGKTPLIKAMEKRVYSAVDTMLSMYDASSIDPTNKNDILHFCIACARNNVTLVKYFVQKGMNINIVLDNYFDEWVGCTPLYLAVLNLSLEVVKKLLSYGANFVVTNQRGFSPLHNAYNMWQDRQQLYYRNKTCSIIDLFLSAHKSIITNPVDVNGISHFYIACVRNNVTVVKSFLDSGVHLKNERTTLHNAVRYNCFEVINVLLNHGFKIDSKDSEGNTPLHIALEYKFYHIAKLLVEHNAKVLIVNKYGNTPIHKAFFHLPDSELADLMLSTCNKKLENIKCQGNFSLFHIACARGNAELVKNFMLQCDIDIDEQVRGTFMSNNFNFNGFTALHFATCAQTLKIVELLLKSNARVDATDIRGVTALWYALDSQPKYYDVNNFIAENVTGDLIVNSGESVKQKTTESIFDHFDHIRILKLLLKSGSDPNYKNTDGNPLLFKAYQSVVRGLINMKINYEKQDLVSEICRQYFYKNSRKIIKLLISYGVNRNPRDRNMNSIFHFIIDSMVSHKRITKIAIEVAELLINNGGNPTLVNRCGDSPLFMAVKNGSIEFVKLLLKYNIDINSTNRCLMTSLHIAVSENRYASNLEMIQFLLANGSTIDAKDIEGQTPLFKALYSDGDHSSAAVKLLLEANCDVNIQDKFGRTALSIAASRDNPDAVKILLEYGADINMKDNFNNSLLKQIEMSSDDIFRVLEILAVHVYKLSLIGCNVSSENLEIFGHLNLVKPTVIYALRKELEALKENKLDTYTSLYDVLRKSIQEMTRHVKNETLKNLVIANAVTDNFPNYGNIINLKYLQGIARIKILKNALDCFRLFEKGNLLPDSCIDSIFSYLTNKDLESLSHIQQ